MKMLRYVLGVLLVANIAKANNDLMQLPNVKMMNIDYELKSAQLDAVRFPANNILISLFNMSETTASLSIMNDICPSRPGLPSCRAMPRPMFYGEFKLNKAKLDSCGVRTQKSKIVLQNGERAQLEIKDNRFSVCEIVYFADLEIVLRTKQGSTKSESVILVSNQNITNMPVIVYPNFPNMLLVEESFVSSSVTSKGKFFEEANTLAANVVINHKNKKINLNLTVNPCANSFCEAIKAELFSRELEITSVKSNKCGDKTYFSNSVSVYDAYPQVLGAIHTYVSVKIQDTRNSVCGNGAGAVTAVVNVTERQKLISDLFVNTSVAEFDLVSAE